jgi:hypothetical protein
MSQSITLDVRGEHTYASDISGVPTGSLYLARNVNINRQGIAEPRRGFNVLTYGLPIASDRPKRLVFWNSELFAHYNGTTFAYYNPASGFSSRGSLAAPSNATSARFVSSQNKNLYVTSDAGLKKTDAVATSLYAAGVPKGLTIDLSVAGAGTAVANNMYVTYRYLLGRKDANSNPVLGGVSGRFTIQNTAGSTQNITARCYIPSGLDATYYLQLYKCPESTVAATTDELQLCYETPLSNTHVSNGYVDVTDITPDALLDATIYTAPTQQGLVNDNTRPPLARCIAEYKNCLFFGDVDAPQRFIFSLISSSSTSGGFQAGDTITLTLGATTEIYTGHATTFNSSIKQFVVTDGASTAIDATIKSFIKCVNLASAIVSAFSMTEGATDLPGKVLLEAKSVGTATFTAVSSRAAAFQPQLPTSATINNTSTADTFKHGLMFSKPFEPEAVPIKNIFKVGSSDDRIKQIIALRDGLFIFKERDGCYVLRGDTEANFAVTPLDKTAKIVAPDSLAEVNNLVYGLFEAGICEVSDTGVSIISIPIKDQLQPLMGAPLTALKAYAFGIGSDTDGKYILCVPETSSDTTCTKQHVFDTFGRTFCSWDLNLTCGGVNPVDAKTYLGAGDSNMIKQERKAFDYTDYADFGATCTISSYTGTTVTINNTSGMAAGDILEQGANNRAYVESVDPVAGTVVIDTEQAWTLSTADVTHVKAIDCKVQWNPDFGGNAAGLKQYYECGLILKQAFQKSATLYFTSDLNPSEASIPITSASGNGEWGQFAFGDEVFGGEQARSPKRIGIPRGHARCSQLSVRFENRVAYSDFQLTGLALSFNPTSTRTTR